MTIQNRYDFLYLFDVKDGNPNGDPDAGNLPRVDPQTFQGLVTDGCLKRKIRDYVLAAKTDGNGNEAGFGIYFQTKGGPEKQVLNTIHQQAYTALNKKPKDKKYEDQVAARKWMCDNFYDVRTFGAVMSTEINCGQVRGPAQLTFARSYHPIVQQEVAITRKSVTNVAKAKKQLDEHGYIVGEFGRKSIVPYGLYCAQGFISANEAAGTGFAEADLELLFKALCGRTKTTDQFETTMFDLDRSAGRGMMAARKLFVFKHQSKLGNSPAHRLFDLVKVELTENCRAERAGIPREFGDYTFAINREEIPANVELIELL